MKITMNAKKMQISESFTDYAEKRLSAKLDKFFGDEAEANVKMSEFKGNIVLELTVRYNQMIYRSEQSAQDKRDALDAAIDKIIRQIRKNKTRLEKRLKDTAFKQEFQDVVEEQPDFAVIRRKKFNLRPMTVEEAILQMDMLGHAFFMFKDASTGNTCVVYQRENEGYAVLEPDEE
ncbi:MAG: ribosome-associated translation inhibitor RaiA [Oscillospiraceae bacterium]|nr:ribosome-associated translation inhibitor RaiA [Oscillospiraceae bacterium]MBR4101166.1 ribosome-associated translation inhibitor RaiA [Oscillospiraceae bacterium]